MNKYEKTRDLLIRQYQKYPKIQIQDIFKYLHQSALGCEHLISDLQSAIKSIDNEYESADSVGDTLIDELDGEFCRVHLSYLERGLSAQTLGKLLFASAKTQAQGIEKLTSKLAVARELISDGSLPFSIRDFDDAAGAWSLAGYPSIHHSQAYREAYEPAYRVISNRYLPFLPVFERIDASLKEKETVIAIEGGSASGKTTLAKMLESVYDCTVFHMDDFFLRPEQRTKERYSEVGGNIDRERFLDEVLTPLKKRESVRYQRFDCETMTLAPAVEIIPKRLTVIEGAYSMHPAFSGFYDFSVFLNICPDMQRKRILKRNTPPMAERFFAEWIPLEEIYFSQTQVAERCELSVLISE